MTATGEAPTVEANLMFTKRFKKFKTSPSVSPFLDRRSLMKWERVSQVKKSSRKMRIYFGTASNASRPTCWLTIPPKSIWKCGKYKSRVSMANGRWAKSLQVSRSSPPTQTTSRLRFFPINTKPIMPKLLLLAKCKVQALISLTNLTQRWSCWTKITSNWVLTQRVLVSAQHQAQFAT